MVTNNEAVAFARGFALRQGPSAYTRDRFQVSPGASYAGGEDILTIVDTRTGVTFQIDHNMDRPAEPGDADYGMQTWNAFIAAEVNGLEDLDGSFDYYVEVMIPDEKFTSHGGAPKSWGYLGRWFRAYILEIDSMIARFIADHPEVQS